MSLARFLTRAEVAQVGRAAVDTIPVDVHRIIFACADEGEFASTLRSRASARGYAVEFDRAYERWENCR